MSRFAAAARQADQDRLPVVEGVAVRLARGARRAELETALQRLLAEQLGGAWDVHVSGRWVDAIAHQPPPPLDRTWDTVRSVAQLPGVDYAEPLLLLRVPTTDAQEAQARLGLWGIPYDEETRKRLQEASQAHDWSLKQMKVAPDAWDRWRTAHGGAGAPPPGQDARVAHPDTGYTRHQQITPILDGTGKNYVETDHPDDALSDLSEEGFLQFPGHGTGTASVLASPTGDVVAADDVMGVAPGSRVRPLRVSNTVIHLSFSNLAQALDDAITDGAHVVSMSLGGPLAPERLRDAVRRALDAGIILVAAAGNYLPTVMFPAALPGVIACAASNALRLPWRFSGLGDEVVITAPGEGVWRATAALDTAGQVEFGMGQGEGTSHATAAVAGVAALWLSFHGRDTLLDRYGKPLLPFAFLLLLRQTADASPEWVDGGHGGFGAGIADADALLGADLPEPDTVKAFRQKVLRQGQKNLIDLTFDELIKLFHVPTHTPAGVPRLAVNSAASPGTPDATAVRRLVADLLGAEPDDPALVRELTALIASRPLLHRNALSAAQRLDLARQRTGEGGDSGE